jgi:hypothetical protein
MGGTVTFRRAVQGRRLLATACALVAMLSAGCVVVPYSPPTESQSAPVRLENADQVVLTIGPREMLEETSASLRRRDRELEVVDSLAFRNSIFPEGGWQLSKLLDPAVRPRLTASGADYLVVVGPVRVAADEGHGLFLEIPGYGFYGAASGSTQGSALVLIVDLARGEVLDAVETRARGTDVAVGFFYGLIVHATTETSVRSACLDSVVETVRAARPKGVVRLALMAAEPVASSNYALSVITE